MADPTHVRPITILGLSLYDQELNKIWEKNNAANTPLGFIHKVNFKIVSVKYVPDEKYRKLLVDKVINEKDLKDYSEKYNNVIKEIFIKWKVVK